MRFISYFKSLALTAAADILVAVDFLFCLGFVKWISASTRQGKNSNYNIYRHWAPEANRMNFSNQLGKRSNRPHKINTNENLLNAYDLTFICHIRYEMPWQNILSLVRMRE